MVADPIYIFTCAILSLLSHAFIWRHAYDGCVCCHVQMSQQYIVIHLMHEFLVSHTRCHMNKRDMRLIRAQLPHVCNTRMNVSLMYWLGSIATWTRDKKLILVSHTCGICHMFARQERMSRLIIDWGQLPHGRETRDSFGTYCQIHRKSSLYLPISSVNLVLKLMGTPDGISTHSGWNRVSRWWCRVSPGIYILSWLKL